MTRTPNKKKSYDLGTAVRVADVFYRNSSAFIASVGTDMKTGPNRALNRLEDLIVSATELSFAAELYLKSLWIRLGLSIPETHHLWSLFKDLPDAKLRDSIIASYDASNSTEGSGMAALQVALSVGPADDSRFQEAANAQARKHDPSFKGVITRCSNGFQTWRYMFEQGVPGEIRFFTYEFSRLDLIARVVRSYAVSPPSHGVA